MRCKPGDLAMIVKPYDVQENLGAMVRVVSVIRHNGEWCWLFEDASRPIVVVGAFGRRHSFSSSSERPPGTEPVIEDGALMPIRPQPDDAVDEVIQRLGTPHKETA